MPRQEKKLVKKVRKDVFYLEDSSKITQNYKFITAMM